MASNRVEITAGGSFTDGINVGSALNVRGKNNTTGNALVEAYTLSP